MSSKLFSGFRWVCTVSSRFSRIDRTGRSAVTSFLATLGICFGVMTLVVVTGVMNGFQMGFKDAIMEISSYHVRVTGMKEKDSSFESWCASRKNNISAIPFREAQALIVGSGGEQFLQVIRRNRAIGEDITQHRCHIGCDHAAALDDRGQRDRAAIDHRLRHRALGESVGRADPSRRPRHGGRNAHAGTFRKSGTYRPLP